MSRSVHLPKEAYKIHKCAKDPKLPIAIGTWLSLHFAYPDPMLIREAIPEDVSAIVQIIDAAYQRVGDRVWLKGCDQDLQDVDKHYTQEGGAFVVLENEGEIIGTHATKPVDPNKGLLTFRRLYLKPEYHGGDAGRILFQWALDWAAHHRYKRIEFWSDVRFKRAHRFFKKFGFINTQEIRHMDDALQPYSEYKFVFDLEI